MAQETISNWADDYGGADTNTPADGTTITTSGDGTLNDKAFQEVKAVIREESLNRDYEPDARTAVRVSTLAFKIVGADLRAVYSPGEAVKVFQAAAGVTPVSGFIETITFAAGDTTFTLYGIRDNVNTEQTIPVGIDRARFSAWRARRSPEVMRTYPATDVPSFVPRVWQAGTIRCRTGAGGSSFLAYEEPDVNYYVSLQVIGFNGSPPEDAFLVNRVVKKVDEITIQLRGAPGSGNLVLYEFVILRYIGGVFV